MTKIILLLGGELYYRVAALGSREPPFRLILIYSYEIKTSWLSHSGTYLPSEFQESLLRICTAGSGSLTNTQHVESVLWELHCPSLGLNFRTSLPNELSSPMKSTGSLRTQMALTRGTFWVPDPYELRPFP